MVFSAGAGWPFLYLILQASVFFFSVLLVISMFRFKKHIIWKAVAFLSLLVVLFIGLFFISPGMKTVNAIDESHPVVYVSIGMKLSEVIEQSSYPLESYATLLPTKKMNGYDIGSSIIVTDYVSFKIADPSVLVFNNIRFWDISYDSLGVINDFSGDTSFMNIEDAFSKIHSWTSAIDATAWVRVKDNNDFMFSSQPNRKTYETLSEVKQSFLSKEKDKINVARVGTWISINGEQSLSLTLTHKMDDGGPRYASSPVPISPLEDINYLLRFYVTNKWGRPK